MSRQQNIRLIRCSFSLGNFQGLTNIRNSKELKTRSDESLLQATETIFQVQIKHTCKSN
jgi:hypothetical protein